MGSRIYPTREPDLYLAEWREHLGLTQEQLGLREPLNCSGVTVGRWERWREPKGRRPDLNTLAAIAEALGRPVADMFRHPLEPSIDDLLRGQSPEVVQQAMRLVKAILR